MGLSGKSAGESQLLERLGPVVFPFVWVVYIYIGRAQLISLRLRRLILGNHQTQHVADRQNADQLVSFSDQE